MKGEHAGSKGTASRSTIQNSGQCSREVELLEIEGEGLRDGCEPCCDVLFGDGAAKKRTGGQTGGGRDEDP